MSVSDVERCPSKERRSGTEGKTIRALMELAFVTTPGHVRGPSQPSRLSRVALHTVPLMNTISLIFDASTVPMGNHKAPVISLPFFEDVRI